MNTRFLRAAGTLLTLAVLWPTARPAVAQNRGVEDRLPPPPRKIPVNLPMQSILRDAEQVAKIPVPLPQLQKELSNRGMTLRDDGKLHVEIIGPRGGPALQANVLAPFGGDVDNTWRHRIDAWVPLAQLSNIARALPPGYFMERANIAGLDSTGGEGATAINSASYRNGGANGNGLTIAVIDTGYASLTTARNAGDAPATGSWTAINYGSSPFENAAETDHGTGCVEAAFDNCPGATFRLYKIDSLTDMGTAVDNAIANGVDVISHSLSRYNLGWNDNEGDACDAAAEAADNGILFFTSAGNRAQDHWQGNFNAGPDADNWHNWSGADETVNITVAPGNSSTYYLSWNTTGGTYDYDLYLYDSTLTNVLASSTNSGNTYEEFTWTNTSGSTATVHLAVFRDGGGTTEFEVFVSNGTNWQEHAIAAGSTTSPSNSTRSNVISNGAVDWSDYGSPNGTSGIIQGYSSRGPSNSGMTLPDLCGPTNTGTTSNGGSFGGTSCAAPSNAGAACAFWSADTQLSASAVRWLMYEQAGLWRDWGAAGHDNTYGRGGGILIDYAPKTIWVARSYGNIADLRSAPFYHVQAAHDAALSGGRLLIFPGGNYPEPATLTKALLVKTVENAAVLGD